MSSIINKLIISLSAGIVTTGLILGTSVQSAFAHQQTLVSRDHSNQLYMAQARTYQVKLGDTISGIASKNGLTVSQILGFNPSLKNNPNLIRVGQIIYLSQVSKPTPTPKPSPNTQASRRRVSTETFKITAERRQSSNRTGTRRGSERDECRVNSEDELRILLPESNFGYTLRDYPTFFWYMPQLKVPAAGLELRIRPMGGDRNSEQVYQVANSDLKAGIMSFTLPTENPPLAEDQEYKWEVRLKCTEQTFIYATGNIKRMKTDNPELSQKLAAAPVEDYPAILAEAGVWYDALAMLTALQKENPKDATLAEDWVSILKMIGFDNIAAVTAKNP